MSATPAPRLSASPATPETQTLSLLSTARTLVGRHLQLGLSGILLTFDAAMLCLVVIDIYRFHEMGFSVYGALRLQTGNAWRDAAGDIVQLLLLLVVLVPIILGIARVVGMQLPFSMYRLSPRRVGRIHFGLLIPLLCGAVLMEVAMRVLSGLKSSGLAAPSSLFYPMFEEVPHFLRLILANLPSLLISWKFLASLAGAAAMAYLGYQQWPRMYQDYLLAVELANVEPGHVPIVNEGANLSPQVLGPETKIVRREVTATLSVYQNARAAQASQQLVSNVVKQTRELIGQVLLPKVQDYEIHFLPDRLQSLLAAISTLPPEYRIVLLPFLDSKIATFLRGSPELRMRDLVSIGKGQIANNWEDEQRRIVALLKQALPPKVDGLVLITEEVDQETGLALPIPRLIAEIRSIGYGTVETIVDGTSAVGNNGRLRSLADSTIYVFATNQWLLSPEPCGVAISRSERKQNSALDWWEDSLAFAPANLRAISAFCAALKCVKECGNFEALWLREERLARKFKQGVLSVFDIVGDTQNLERTFLVTIRPKNGYRWSSEATSQLEKLGLSGCISFDGSTMLFKAVFPYYLNLWRLNRSCQALCNMVDIQ